LIGLVWLIGRIIYMRGYMADPSKRLLGAMVGGLTSVILFIIAACGVIRAVIASLS
jgi:glutathione S-transferase